eukprot:scaffold22893_cov27-Tisochrysis_lutea.AAC.1
MVGLGASRVGRRIGGTAASDDCRREQRWSDLVRGAETVLEGEARLLAVARVVERARAERHDSTHIVCGGRLKGDADEPARAREDLGQPLALEQRVELRHWAHLTTMSSAACTGSAAALVAPPPACALAGSGAPPAAEPVPSDMELESGSSGAEPSLSAELLVSCLASSLKLEASEIPSRLCALRVSQLRLSASTTYSSPAVTMRTSDGSISSSDSTSNPPSSTKTRRAMKGTTSDGRVSFAEQAASKPSQDSGRTTSFPLPSSPWRRILR